MEAERQTAAQREAARQEAEKAAQVEAARQEAERATQAEAARQDAAKAARADATRQEAAQAQAEAAEAARQEAERRASAQQAAQQEAARQASAQADAARQEASRQATAQAEAGRQEAARNDAARQTAAQQAPVTGDAARDEAARAAAAKREAALAYEQAREERLRVIGRQLNEEADRRAATEAAARAGPDDRPSSWSSLRRGRIYGRSDANEELTLYALDWSRKIELNMTFGAVADLVKQRHTAPVVTVAVRSDGSVESINFVRSSGVPAIDEAVRRVVQGQANYPAFSPALAREFDVIEIRRTWHFDMAIRLY
jgi:TonB family protein